MFEFSLVWQDHDKIMGILNSLIGKQWILGGKVQLEQNASGPRADPDSDSTASAASAHQQH